MLYAGVGSRRTPESVRALMRKTGYYLALKGWTLRSGGARGADRAFDDGVSSINGPLEVWTITRELLPEAQGTAQAPSDEDWQRAHELAAEHHPAWERCLPVTRALHARNSLVLLGHKLDSPVKFVLAWTPSARSIGGTGQTMRVAKAMGIPVFNFAAHKRTEMSLIVASLAHSGGVPTP